MTSILLVCLLLISTACLCTTPPGGGVVGGRGEEDDAAAVDAAEGDTADEGAADDTPQAEEPQPSPTVPTNEVTDEVGGFTMLLPDDWVTMSTGYGYKTHMPKDAFASMMDTSSSGEGDDSAATIPLDSPHLVTLIVVTGPDTPPGSDLDLLESYGADTSSPEAFFASIQTASTGETANVAFDAPYSATIGGIESTSADFSGTDPLTGEEINGSVVVISTEDRQGGTLAMASGDTWSEFQPQYEAILETLDFFQTEPFDQPNASGRRILKRGDGTGSGAGSRAVAHRNSDGVAQIENCRKTGPKTGTIGGQDHRWNL